MKIALYSPWIFSKSGSERTILETVKRSAHEYTIFTNRYDKMQTFPEFKKIKVIELKRIPIRHNLISEIQNVKSILFQKIDLSSFNLFIIHSEGFADLILFRNSKIPTICFCHTPLRPVYDSDNRSRVLEQKSFTGKSAYSFFSYIFQVLDKKLWRRYKYILFNSQESFRRAKEGHLLGGRRYTILHPGISWETIRPSWIFDKYFLVPGRITWSKNIELAIEAFIIFEQKTENTNKFKLIIAGQVDRKGRKYLTKLISLSKQSKNIVFIPNPTDTKLRTLYSNCYLTLGTAFNEDWGLTPIEANAFGKPVLAVKNGGFRESQVNNKTGYLLKPSPDEFANKMISLSQNLSLVRRLGKYARDHSQRYSWTKFITEQDRILESVRIRYNVRVDEIQILKKT